MTEKLSCRITQDLILLYTDGVCSQESRQAVEEHLKQCPSCRKYLQEISLPEKIVIQTPEPQCRERVMKNSFRKIRRRWRLSVLAVFMIFPILLLGILGVHEFLGTGVAYTNLDDIVISYRFMWLVEDGRFEEAAEMICFDDYAEIVNRLKEEPGASGTAAEYDWMQEHFGPVAEMTEEAYVAHMQAKFVQAMENCYAAGYGISGLHFADAYHTGSGWSIGIGVREYGPDGLKYSVEYTFSVRAGKVRIVSGTKPKQTERDPIFEALAVSFALPLPDLSDLLLPLPD